MKKFKLVIDEKNVNQILKGVSDEYSLKFFKLVVRQKMEWNLPENIKLREENVEKWSKKRNKIFNKLIKEYGIPAPSNEIWNVKYYQWYNIFDFFFKEDK